jgi:hypothetical protein
METILGIVILGIIEYLLEKLLAPASESPGVTKGFMRTVLVFFVLLTPTPVDDARVLQRVVVGTGAAATAAIVSAKDDEEYYG